MRTENVDSIGEEFEHFRHDEHHIHGSTVTLIVVGQLTEIIVPELDLVDDFSLADGGIVVTGDRRKELRPLCFLS
jgi:hypothetical protein